MFLQHLPHHFLHIYHVWAIVLDSGDTMRLKSSGLAIRVEKDDVVVFGVVFYSLLFQTLSFDR